MRQLILILAMLVLLPGLGTLSRDKLWIGQVFADERIAFIPATRPMADEFHMFGRKDSVVVVYLFSPNVSEHRNRASSLEQLWRQYKDSHEVKIIGIIHQSDGSSFPPEAFKKDLGISYTVLGSLASEEGRTLSKRLLSEHASTTPDLTAVIGRDDRIEYLKTGYSPQEILAKVKWLLRATSVDDSTWGRIKELFR